MEVHPLTQTPSLLTKGVTDAKRDSILVVGEPPTGALVYRPAAWVHELQVGRDMVSRLRAAVLIEEAMKRDGTRCAVFIVAGDNIKMQRFVEDLGAVRQSDPGDVLYTLTV